MITFAVSDACRSTLCAALWNVAGPRTDPRAAAVEKLALSFSPDQSKID